MDYDHLTRFATGIDWENAEQSIEKTQNLKKMIDEREERQKWFISHNCLYHINLFVQMPKYLLYS